MRPDKKRFWQRLRYFFKFLLEVIHVLAIVMMAIVYGLILYKMLFLGGGMH